MSGRAIVTLVWQDGSTETVDVEDSQVMDGCLVLLHWQWGERRIPLTSLRDWTVK